MKKKKKKKDNNNNNNNNNNKKEIILTGHKNHVTSVRFKNEKNIDKLYSCGYDNNIIIWDTENQKIIKKLKDPKAKFNTKEEEENDKGLTNISIYENLISSAGRDAIVRLFDEREGKCIKRFKGHEGFVLANEFDDTGAYLYSGGKDANVKIWDLKKFKERNSNK